MGIAKISKVSNPLTIIAIFAGLAEIGGTLVLPFLEVEIQIIYIWFLMLFPVCLVFAFFGVLYTRHIVLYAPSDFKDEGNFISAQTAVILKATPAEVRQKAEEQKAEEQKAEEPKAEEPKAEEPKAEEPKAEEPKSTIPRIIRKSYEDIEDSVFLRLSKDYENLTRNMVIKSSDDLRFVFDFKASKDNSDYLIEVVVTKHARLPSWISDKMLKINYLFNSLQEEQRSKTIFYLIIIEDFEAKNFSDTYKLKYMKILGSLNIKLKVEFWKLSDL